MANSGMQRSLIVFITGGIVGFFVGYASTYEKPEAASPVAISAADKAAAGALKVNAKPVRTLEASPKKGSDKPKIIIHEVSEFQ